MSIYDSLMRDGGSQMMNEDTSRVIESDDFHSTLVTYAAFAKKVSDFIQLKLENPTQRYGSSDTRFIPDGYLGQLKVSHAHVSQDVSILYRIAGTPTKLFILGLYSHKETGTGTTPNNKKQKSMATKFKNQFPVDQYQELKEDQLYQIP